jgi:hypothetical protein
MRFDSRLARLAATAVVVAFALFAVWIGKGLVLRLSLAISEGTADEINKLLLALAGLIGAPFLVWRTWIADRQRHIAQEELFTSLLTKAVEQLGATREEKTYEIPETKKHFDGILSRLPAKPEALVRTVPNTEVRLGAIYALEKLAHDYLPLHRQIVDILCAYVRKNAGSPKPCSEEIRATYAKGWAVYRRFNEEAALKPREDELKFFVDVQAALTVIGRRSKKQRNWEFENRRETDYTDRLDLRSSHLAGVDLRGLHFELADFSGSCFEGAQLDRADFQNALFIGAHLEGAFLDRAHLDRAMFSYHEKRAHLEGAWLSAHLKGADLNKVRTGRRAAEAKDALPRSVELGALFG